MAGKKIFRQTLLVQGAFKELLHDNICVKDLWYICDENIKLNILNSNFCDRAIMMVFVPFYAIYRLVFAWKVKLGNWDN